MASVRRLVAFVATANSAKSLDFYKRLLGLALIEETSFALVFDAWGTTLRIQKVEKVSIAPYTALGWEVADIDAEVTQLNGLGVRFERFEGLVQDEMNIWLSPSGGRVAWFKDPDGNLLSLTQLTAV